MTGKNLGDLSLCPSCQLGGDTRDMDRDSYIL